MRRTQIYLHAHQADELARRSGARGVTTSHLIREAIEEYLAGHDEETALLRQRASLREAFGTLPGLPDGATFVDEARRGDRERDARLEQQWRSRR